MKTCYINNLYPPYAVGGAEQVVLARAKAALARGEQVVVITSGPKESFSSKEPVKTLEEGSTVYRYWVPNLCWYRDLGKHNFLFRMMWHKIDVWNWKSTKIVQKILEAEKPDAVETHNLMGLGYGIPRLIQRLGIKHIQYLHDVQLVEPSGVLAWNHERDSVFQTMYGWIVKWKIGKPAIVISPSQFLEKFYKDRKFFESSEWKLEIAKLGNYEIRQTTRKDKFLFVGTLVKHKGLEVLLEAWRGLPSDADVILTIVGDGELREQVEQFAKEDQRVKYLGRLEKEALERVYREHDFLIFPSICLENRPTVIVEALRYGLRVIASDTGGVSELIEDRINGWLIEPGNADLLQEMIEIKASL